MPVANRTVVLDLPGIALFAAMLTSLLLVLMSPSIEHLWLLALSLAAAGALAARELHTVEPFLDLRVFAGNLALLRTYGRTFLAQFVGYCFLYGFTQWLEDSRDLGATAAGLLLLPLTGTALLVSSAFGRRPEIRRKLLVGSLAQVVGCAALLFTHAGSGLWLIIVVGLVMGLPQGLNSLANQNAVYYQAEASRMGASAGLSRTFTYLGAIGASAASGAFFPHTADTAGLHHLALLMLVVAVLFLLLTALDRALLVPSAKGQP